MFANALRIQLRLRVPTVARVVLPASRSISSLVYRTAVAKNVSLSASRFFTTSQVVPNEYRENTPNAEPNATVFVANIPWNSTEADLAEVFGEFGVVLGVRMHMNSEGRPRGIAHVDYATKEGAVAAVESASQEPIHLAGRDLRIDFAVGPRNQQGNSEPSEKLYFSGFSGDETELRTIFKDFGESIVDIHLLRHPLTGVRTPAGFLQFTSTELATEALEALDGVQIPGGDTLAVSYARPRRNQSIGNSDRDSRQGSSGSYRGQRVRRSSPRWNNERENGR